MCESNPFFLFILIRIIFVDIKKRRKVYIMEEYKAVVVTDEKKIKEIKSALRSGESSIANVKPAEPDKLPENAQKIWFGKVDK